MSEAVDISPNKDGGVLKKILVEGEGDAFPTPGCQVRVHYTGTLIDGTKFDSSRDRNQPFEFNLGKGSVIKGWDIGVATMKKGERAILTCAPKYAYGEAGSPPAIPPNSILDFDVEVIAWKGEDLSPKHDGGIERIPIVAGEGYTTPNDGALVNVHLVGVCEGKEFENRTVTFTLGEGAVENIVFGVEKAIEGFKKGETSRLIIKPQYAFGAQGDTALGIPANATVEYVVTLNEFEKAKESWSLDSNERLDQAKLFKEKGTTYFKANRYELAVKMYKKAIEFIETDKDPELETDRIAVLLASHLNLSLCYLKQNNDYEAKQSATAALKIDEKSEKAFFRRGQALLNLGEPKLASDDFAKCLAIDPNNKAAQTQQALCAKKLKLQLEQEKKVYANMFDKFAKRDAQREEIKKKEEINVLSSVGEWGKEDREREPTEFEKQNPDILLLDGSGQFKDM